MTLLLVIVLIILLILVTRLSIILTYNDSGAGAALRVYFIKYTVYPRQRPEKKRAKKQRKGRRKKRIEEDAEKEEKKEEQGGSIERFKEIFEMIQSILSRIKRHLLIRDLTLHYTVSCDDAAKAAIHYGSACVLMGSLLPAIEGNFKIKNRDIKIDVDFTGSGGKIYAKGIISLAIWEIIYIAGALLTSKSFKKAVFSGKK